MFRRPCRRWCGLLALYCYFFEFRHGLCSLIKAATWMQSVRMGYKPYVQNRGPAAARITISPTLRKLACESARRLAHRAARDGRPDLTKDS
jgi:hypothetical protein